MNKILTAIVIVGIIVVGVLYFSHEEEPNTGAEASAGPEIDYASDVIGSRTGTSTAGTYFSDGTSTTTARVRTSGASLANFTVLPTSASSTGALATFTFFGSNDFDCATASTTGGTQNPILTTDINWYDIGDHVAELAGSQSLTGTSTIAMTPYTGLGTDITLTNLNYECIKVEAAASSTIMLMQVRLKK